MINLGSYRSPDFARDSCHVVRPTVALLPEFILTWNLCIASHLTYCHSISDLEVECIKIALGTGSVFILSLSE